MVVATQTQFDERNPSYYTSSCCHVRTGVIVISIIEIVYVAFGVILAFTSVSNAYYTHPTMGYNVKWSALAHAIIMVVGALLAIGGMRGIKPALLIPYIVIKVIILVILLACILILIIHGINMGPYFNIAFVLYIGFAVWFMVVFVRGYKYLKDKKEFLVNNQNSFVAKSGPITGCNQAVYAEGQPAPSEPNYAQFGYAKAP